MFLYHGSTGPESSTTYCFEVAVPVRLIPRAFFARSPGGSTVMFRYYLLVGDTAAPSGLYARLCHAFLEFFVFDFEYVFLLQA